MEAKTNKCIATEQVALFIILLCLFIHNFIGLLPFSRAFPDFPDDEKRSSPYLQSSLNNIISVQLSVCFVCSLRFFFFFNKNRVSVNYKFSISEDFRITEVYCLFQSLPCYYPEFTQMYLFHALGLCEKRDLDILIGSLSRSN